MSLVNSDVNAGTMLGKETDVSSRIVFRNKTVATRSTQHSTKFVLQVYVGVKNKGKAQNQEELLPRSSKLTDEQPDQISQESSNEQQLCASSSIQTTASNKVAIEKGTLKEPTAT
ncbi:Armadillo-like helical domain containing protein [Dorcoceras hygrometricum]|nr:Armadillo-like helical domain containing protein [Dorcoceras hygrometricum]